MGLASEVLAFVGKGVANGALSAVGGDIAGFVLQQIFGGGGNNPAIAQLGQQLSAIQNTLNVISGELSTIEAELQSIAQQQLYQAWANVDQEIGSCITQISVQYKRYVEYAQNSSTTTQAEIDQLVLEILSTNTGAEVSLAEINAKILGNGLDKGVLQLWSEMVTPLIQSGQLQYPRMLNAYMKYYIQIAYAQIQAANLLVEAFNKQNNQPLAKAKWTEYQAYMSSQEIPFVQYVDGMIYAAIAANNALRTVFDWYTGMQAYYAGGGIRYTNSTEQYSDPVWTNFAAFYRPSQEHYQVEEILANAQAMGPTQRRVVVWLIYPCTFAAPGFLGNSVDLEIVAGSDPDGAGISAASSTNIVASTNPPHSIKRFVYSTPAIADGSYVLKDLNSEYPRYSSSSSDSNDYYFQHPMYFEYTMNISPAKQFDFMDISPYALFDVYS